MGNACLRFKSKNSSLFIFDTRRAAEHEDTRHWKQQKSKAASSCMLRCMLLHLHMLRGRQLWAGSGNAILLNCSRKCQWQWQATGGTLAIGESSAKCKSQAFVARVSCATCARFACDFCSCCQKRRFAASQRRFKVTQIEVILYFILYIDGKRVLPYLHIYF